jgi:LacI family transcriptional regulator
VNLVKERSAILSVASAARPQRGALHHARRSVLLLLGFYNIRLHTGIMRYAREADWVLDDTYVRNGMPPVGWRGDGILTLVAHVKDIEALRQYPKLPLVDFSKGWITDTTPEEYRASGIGRPRVYYDNERIGRLAAEHFLERAFKHVAYLNCGNYWMEVERMPSFRQALEAAGCHYHEIPYYQCFPQLPTGPLRSHQQAHQWLVKTLRELPKPLGIAASTDDLACRLLRACDDADLCVPEEVAVLGCDDNPMVCDYALVPLSSVDADWERIGYEGAELLDRLMDGKRAPRAPILIPPKGVVTRLSTHILAVPDLAIARAMRFIWEHYPNAIGTPEVAAAAGLSRRTLERGFHKHLGQSVNHEITQVRVERAKQILLGTRLRAHEVALECGFSDVVHLSKAFHRLTGIRPSQFRRQQQGISPPADAPP